MADQENPSMLAIDISPEIRARQARERRKLTPLGQMSAVMAHELRNPLASAKGNAQLLTEMLGPGTRAHQKAEQVVRDLLRVEASLNELLEFVRSGEVTRSLCDPVALLLEAALQFSGAAIEVELAGAPPRWSLDPQAMGRVLVNLLRNAIQAQEDDQTPLRLVVTQRGGELYMAVRDHGPGLAEGVDVFAPFTSTKTTGTGLGLAVSRQSVEAHGGRLSLKNHPEGGAIAEIFIPSYGG